MHGLLAGSSWSYTPNIPSRSCMLAVAKLMAIPPMGIPLPKGNFMVTLHQTLTHATL